MLINAAVLQALRTSAQANFRRGLQSAPSTFSEVATVVPSTTSSNTYDWLSDVPSLQEWLGPREIKNIKTMGYTIKNRDFESTISIKRTDIEDDNLGTLKMRAEAQGYAASIWYDELTYPLLPNGLINQCYDGQSFFDTDHPVAEKTDGTGQISTQSNLFRPTSGGAESPEPWYLLDTSRPLKPLIFQERKKPFMTDMIKEDDEGVFMQNEYRFGIAARGEAGYGFWQLAAYSTLPLTPENFKLVYGAMRKLKKDGHRPIAVKPTMIVVPPSLEDTAEEILLSERLPNGATNTLRNKVKIHAPQWL